MHEVEKKEISLVAHPFQLWACRGSGDKAPSIKLTQSWVDVQAS
jgi:hypothetical protein